MRSERDGDHTDSAALTIAYEFEREGRFSSALQALDRGTVGAGEKRAADVLRAQLLERTGKYVQSKALIGTLVKMKDLSPRDRSACELVSARLAWDGAEIDSAIVHLQRSIEFGKRAGDLERVCWAQLRLVSMLRDTSGVEAVAVLIAELRANSTKLGQASVLAAVHIFIGQMEAQRGLFASARRHVQIGLRILVTKPNLWLEATAENVNFGISVLLSDLDAGLIQGKRALHLAESSGAASTIGTSLGNLGNLYYLLGHFDEAVDYHQRALALVTTSGENWNAGLESLAQIRLAQSRTEECGALLDEISGAIKTDADQGRYIYRHAGTRKRSPPSILPYCSHIGRAIICWPT
jgi:tetratricopeptide (TPR) repeat protein